MESLKRGKEVSDKEVEVSLFKRACGYEHQSEEIFCSKTGEVTRVPTIKRYPPDTLAAIFWLKNRKPDQWREKQEVEHKGNIISTVVVADQATKENLDKLGDFLNGMKTT